MDKQHDGFAGTNGKLEEPGLSSTGSSAPTTAQGFVPPRHWVGPEELNAAYWSDAKAQEKRAQEFHDKPVEWLEKIDQMDKKGVARRDFLTLMGASMAMAGAACARRPVHKIIPYVVKPEEVTPGVAAYYASTCLECPCGCGVIIKTREGRPIKLEGNPDHPINQGALCIQGQASVLGLYDLDRLKGPIARTRSDHAAREITWESVDQEIGSKLREIAAKGKAVEILSGEVRSESTRKLIGEFLSAFKSGSHVEFEPLQLSELPESQMMSYGSAVIPYYRFDRADYVLSLGSDFLGTSLSSTEYSREWAKKRQLRDQKAAQATLSKMVCFESMMSVTGANADERFPVRPGDELRVALALAHDLIVRQKRSPFAGDASIVSALGSYSVEKAAADLGIADGAAKLKQIAEDLWANRGRGLVISGSLTTKSREARDLQVVTNLLNSALENEGSTVDGTSQTSRPAGSFAAVSRLIQDMKAGRVGALILYRSNPAYTLPKIISGAAGLSSGGPSEFEEALKQVPLVIAVADRDDETAHLADYVLADHHFLEGWGDANPRNGVYSLQQPAISPLHSSRSFQDNLLIWKESLRSGGSSVKGKDGSATQDWHAYLKQFWKDNYFKMSGSPASFDNFWESVLRAGVFLPQRGAGSTSKSVARKFQTASLKGISDGSGRLKSRPADEVILALYANSALYDGKNANNPWLQELPDPISTVTWDNYLNVAPASAKKWGFKENDVVEVRSGDLAVEVPVHIQPGLNPSVVSVAVGYGRRSVGKVGNFAGIDMYPFVQVVDGQLVFSGLSVKLKKTGKIYKLASTQWHNVTEDRPILNDVTLAEYRRNPAVTQHTDPELKLETVPTMWPKHDYNSYRWGMAIDLNSCTGCGACVVACQAENNIPVVGRDQVRVSRQMHWLKIDRYYSGSMENPDVVFQPMLCQHCENAPCETVCPVLATVHDDEGLNVQVYNRCVGTRYCQNNCPYKVRRFNFFDHWKSYDGTLNLAWNPEVTVRTRGIMEKCTFCVQRIRDAKDQAKDNGERVKDGVLKTACQQTCSTDAIVFGNLNDPQSRVSKMAASPQGFRVLEVLNTRPSITYMTKVRNKVESAHASGGEK